MKTPVTPMQKENAPMNSTPTVARETITISVSNDRISERDYRRALTHLKARAPLLARRVETQRDDVTRALQELVPRIVTNHLNWLMQEAMDASVAVRSDDGIDWCLFDFAGTQELIERLAGEIFPTSAIRHPALAECQD